MAGSTFLLLSKCSNLDCNCSKFDRSWSADHVSIKIARNSVKYCTKFDRSRSAGPEIRSNLLEIRLKMFEIRSILVGRLDACAEMCRTSNSSPWAVFREGRDINTSIRFRTENGLWRSWDESLTLSCLYFVQNRPSRPVP